WTTPRPTSASGASGREQTRPVTSPAVRPGTPVPPAAPRR
ncbi:MAG: hypothetical protein AVDCRST_MAG66-3373, partial [uncultured Pseudonocardia sp.]